jgi:hypothetical protein|tara:strand:- start:478 stop:852 length:375 start_codon:yes stop_codon:yes gene_type:complete
MTNKRKAIDCKLIEASKTSPGYHKYQITILEKDGIETTQPAYGKDMQDAISRLIWNERIDKVSKVSKKTKVETPILFGIVFLGIIGPAIWSVMLDTPLISVAGLSIIALVGTSVYWFNHWLSKR